MGTTPLTNDAKRSSTWKREIRIKMTHRNTTISLNVNRQDGTVTLLHIPASLLAFLSGRTVEFGHNGKVLFFTNNLVKTTAFTCTSSSSEQYSFHIGTLPSVLRHHIPLEVVTALSAARRCWVDAGCPGTHNSHEGIEIEFVAG